MRDPSLLVTNPTRTDPHAGAGGRQVYYVLAPGAEPRGRRPDARRPGAGGLGRAVRRRAHRHPGGARLRRARRRRRSVAGGHPGRLGGDRGTRPGRRSPRPTRSARPARSGPATCTRHCPMWSSSGRARSPGVGVPMVLISGKLAAQRVIGGCDDVREHSPGRAGRRRRGAAGTATVADAHTAPGSAAPGLLGAALRRRGPDAAAAAGGREDPVPARGGPTPAAGTRRRARPSTAPRPAGWPRSSASRRRAHRGRRLHLPGRPTRRPGGSSTSTTTCWSGTCRATSRSARTRPRWPHRAGRRRTSLPPGDGARAYAPWLPGVLRVALSVVTSARSACDALTVLGLVA